MYETVIDLARATASEVGAALDSAGIGWTYDADGDVQMRMRVNQQPWIAPVFYELDQSWQARGQFLEGNLVSHPASNGTTWEIPRGQAHNPTDIANKVLTFYFMPRPGGLLIQVHGAIAPLGQPDLRIRVVPSAAQAEHIERNNPSYRVKREVKPDGTTHFFLMTAFNVRVDHANFIELVRSVADVGLEMFDGPFTGAITVGDQ